MTQERKLQVFVSSTYKDLGEERQAAVQAILTAKHIPAGMELFSAGDQSQLQVIKRWIEESDVFMLILGGRYGSIEKSTGKSYTELEYRHAMELEKPMFAVVASESAIEAKAKRPGAQIADFMELERREDFEAFRKLVMSRVVRTWEDMKDIKIAVGESLREYERDERCKGKGWIRVAEAVDLGSIAEQLAELSKTNERLRQENDSLRANTGEGVPAQLFGGLTFQQISDSLRGVLLDELELEAMRKAVRDSGGKAEKVWNDALDFFTESASSILGGPYHVLFSLKMNVLPAWETLYRMGLITIDHALTQDGLKYFKQLVVRSGQRFVG